MDFPHFRGRKERTLQEIRLKVAAGTPLTDEEFELREHDNAIKRERAHRYPSSHKMKLIAIRAKLRALIPLTEEEAEYRNKANNYHKLYHRKKNPDAKMRKRIDPIDKLAQLAAQEAKRAARAAAKTEAVVKAKLEKAMLKKQAAAAAKPFRSLSRPDQPKATPKTTPEAIRVREPKLKPVEPRNFKPSGHWDSPCQVDAPDPHDLNYDDDAANDLAARIRVLLSKR